MRLGKLVRIVVDYMRGREPDATVIRLSEGYCAFVVTGLDEYFHFLGFYGDAVTGDGYTFLPLAYAAFTPWEIVSRAYEVVRVRGKWVAERVRDCPRIGSPVLRSKLEAALALYDTSRGGGKKR